MRLLLVSLNFRVLEELLPKGATVGFIPTAGDVYDDPYFVRDDRLRLSKLGYRVQDINITKESKESIEQTLTAVDSLFVAGGNTFYLMQELVRKGITEAIQRFVGSDRLYVGASAGAAICGPSLEPYKNLDDPKEAPDLTSLTGLALIDFVVLPHYGKLKYMDQYHQIMKEFAEQYRLVPLRDDEAILLLDSNRYQVCRSAGVQIDD